MTDYTSPRGQVTAKGTNTHCTQQSGLAPPSSCLPGGNSGRTVVLHTYAGSLLIDIQLYTLKTLPTVPSPDAAEP